MKVKLVDVLGLSVLFLLSDSPINCQNLPKLKGQGKSVEPAKSCQYSHQLKSLQRFPSQSGQLSIPFNIKVSSHVIKATKIK